MTQLLKKKLFSHTIVGNSYGFLVDLEPLHNAKYDGMKTSVEIPKWIPMTFRPPPGMVLDDIQYMVAAYIFGSNKDDDINVKEIIVTTSLNTVGDRNTLNSLLPRASIDQEVLNLLACMLTFEERSLSTYCGHWYLPTTVAQYALGWSTPPDTVMQYYQNDYMGKIDYVTKIFVPINDMSFHWYLLVVDKRQGKLVMLDSKHDASKMDTRRRQVKKVALFLEEMFLHQSFYHFEFTSKPQISEYTLVVPDDIGSQPTASNDCGIWVAKWMMDCDWSDDYNIHVDNETRMKLALDLVLCSSNINKDQVIKLAAANWKLLEEKKKRLVIS
ncbi:Ulp1 protease family, carboxy-terminal domain protein [Spatholobus suberectus]|nr:Ulp1 protease family, carboxy-terminal domain protein [Spatholobus suberectus]